jgi:hypothetical protein
MTFIMTIEDAERIIRDWTEDYWPQPTKDQVHDAARALVSHIGGYGHSLSAEQSGSFDLDFYLYENN